MYHVHLDLHCIYGSRDEGGENGDGKKGSEFPGGGKSLEIIWPLVYMYACMYVCGEL